MFEAQLEIHSFPVYEAGLAFCSIYCAEEKATNFQPNPESRRKPQFAHNEISSWNSPNFKEPEISLPCSQQSAILR